jgi:hypothetical protein
LESIFSQYKDWNDLRLGENVRQREIFNPKEWFKQFQERHNKEISMKMHEDDRDGSFPSRVQGEKRRLNYIAERLLQNAVIRA